MSLNKIFSSISIFLLLVIGGSCTTTTDQSARRYGLVIHGGAGSVSREHIRAEDETAYRERLTAALKAGYAVLDTGGSSLDAVEAAIVLMEDSPLFNSGKGAVFTHAGTHELDASIMDGSDLNGGAVAGVRHVKNPIRAARKVMEDSPHVLLSGDGADAFARQQNLEMVPQSYYYTDRRWKALQRRLKEEKTNKEKLGTVGAVALDKQGHLAAGTSTGGMTNKLWGRIGDSPLIGAGTYADDATAGISATGHGEYFIRGAIAYDITALMKYKNWDLDKSANNVIHTKLTEMGGNGGIIGMDRQGGVSMTFNTTGMFRGYLMNGELPVVKLFGDE